MAKVNLSEALANVECVYADVVDIANDMVKPILEPINNILSEIDLGNGNLTPENLRDFMVRLQLRASELGDIREKSAFKARCAEELKDEKYARLFNQAEGAQGIKSNIALLGASEEAVCESLYTLVAGLVKTKLDSAFRMIDTLKSVLMSKMQEAKLAMNGIE